MPSKRASYVSAAVAAYRTSLQRLVAEHGIPPLEPTEAGSRAATVTGAGMAWNELVGPLLDTASVRVLLGGVSRQAVGERVRGLRLLALRTAGSRGSSRRVYPRWQLEGSALEHLPTVLRAIGYEPERTADGWMVASWLCTADPSLGGLRPRDLLASDQLDRLRPLLTEVRHEIGADERATASAEDAAA